MDEQGLTKEKQELMRKISTMTTEEIKEVVDKVIDIQAKKVVESE